VAARDASQPRQRRHGRSEMPFGTAGVLIAIQIPPQVFHLVLELAICGIVQLLERSFVTVPGARQVAELPRQQHLDFGSFGLV
jgi:hypothetical protein